MARRRARVEKEPARPKVLAKDPVKAGASGPGDGIREAMEADEAAAGLGAAGESIPFDGAGDTLVVDDTGRVSVPQMPPAMAAIESRAPEAPTSRGRRRVEKRIAMLAAVAPQLAPQVMAYQVPTREPDSVRRKRRRDAIFSRRRQYGRESRKNIASGGTTSSV